MKKSVCFLILLFPVLSISAQEIVEDEMLQARMHFMNNAKVSYIASADVEQGTADTQLSGQEIPEDIQASFRNKYTEAQQVHWVIKEDRYKVNFVYQGMDMFTYLDRYGQWVKSFTKLPNEELPQVISDFLKSHYPNYQLAKYYLKDTPNGQSYTLAVKMNREYVWLEFDDDGKIQSSQV